MTKRLVYLQNRVNNAAIRRIKNERGDDVIVVPSYTLPDDVVMNGGLYTANEIEASYPTLEDTPAPIGHPYDSNGNYISANSPDGQIYFNCGAFNKNVKRVSCEKYGNRVYVEKHIHVETAMKTERGKKLIEAINKGQPIHTSTGILLEPVNEIGTNSQGKDYDWRATNMTFDHDAILFDEEGAATPDDGVGMMVNANLFKTVRRDGALMQVNTIKPEFNQSFNDLREALQTKLQKRFGDDETHVWLYDFDESMVTFEVKESFYQVRYMKDDNNVALDDEAIEVKRVTTWEPVSSAPTNRFTTPFFGNQQTKEGNDMFKEHIQSVLKANNVDYSEMSDEQQIAEYDKIKANAAESTNEGEQSQPEQLTKADITKIVNAALAANQQSQEAGKRAELAEKLKANGVDLSESEQKAMSVNSLQALVDKTTPAPSAFGIDSGQLNVNHGKESRFSDDLPD